MVLFASAVDYKLVLVGSLLPDIVSHIPELLLWCGGVAFGHSLLLSLLILAGGCYGYARSRIMPLHWVGFGSLTHLVLDQVWGNPKVLLWPLYGWGFSRGTCHGWQQRLAWLQTMVDGELKHPNVVVLEVVGGLVLAAFLFYMVRKGRMGRFLRTGVDE